ncbi:uncharacterized aarf domain-containing protein kinase 1 [Phtheirospermum japonicum]|uniref:Uncharacterized aarf domain-containing protein kinase 1 n=1 Tax=Phtheirospermum japonicum TaxID=374723 RepID=A0A830BJX3_9LAMI|nr:uncharacterized aarf domain-containing protein kinase 1 [Phtheirospermum japonicum]
MKSAMLPLDFKEFQEKVSTLLRPWQRSFQFWFRAVDIYTGYKVFQVRVNLEKDLEKRETMWEKQHEVAADKIYNMCADLGGFFLKVAQIIGKPDLAPAAWVRRLVTLCDQAPATPYNVIKIVLEKELGQSVEEIFERFDADPLGSASIAQSFVPINWCNAKDYQNFGFRCLNLFLKASVHRARLKGDKSDVVVKVQHPGVQDLMMTDIRNLQAFALYMQKTDIKFDLYSVTKEMEKQLQNFMSLDYASIYMYSIAYDSKIGYEFNFLREADAMEKIRRFLRVLVMEYVDGVPILKLGDEMAKRGIKPGGQVAAVAKQNILKSLTLAYGQMILRSGFFHADPHPGNILICRGSEVALLDYGQVKDLPEKLRLGYASLVLAIADNDPIKASESYRPKPTDASGVAEDSALTTS